MIKYSIPIIVTVIITYGLYKKIDIFDTFIVGVKDGMKMALNLFPTMFATILAVNVLVSSGIINAISNLFITFFNSIGFPVAVLPLAILRPISGSSSLAILNDILSKYGPDSFIGRVSSVMQGSTDTTIYIISMYFSSISIKKTRYALIVGLLADLISIILSVIMVKIFLN